MRRLFKELAMFYHAIFRWTWTKDEHEDCAFDFEFWFLIVWMHPIFIYFLIFILSNYHLILFH